MTSSPRPPPSLLGPGGLLQRGIEGYVRFSMRQRWAVLGVALLYSTLCVLGALNIRVDSRLEALLPPDTPSSRAVAELNGRLRTSSPLYFVVQSPDMAVNRSVARELARRVSEWPETRWAMYKRDPDYFLKHRLLYLSADDLTTLTEQIDERYRWEQCARIPGCANLEKSPPPLPTDDDLERLFEKDPDVRSMVSLFGEQAGDFTKAKPRTRREAETQPGGTGARTSDSNQAELGELCDVDKNVCTVQVALNGDPGDLDFALEILDRSEALFAQVRTASDPPKLRMAVSGRYRNAPMTQRLVQSDLQKTTLIGVLLVLLVVLLQFRGLRSVVSLLLPAGLGILWTLGPLSLIAPTLNMISAFTLAVLAGVGIDFGVHLLTHYGRQRVLGESPEAAAAHTLGELLPSLVVAAATTASGFGALAAASFKGFSQMGPIAAAGVLTCLLCFILLFGPLVSVLDRGEQSPFGLRRVAWSPWAWVRRRRVPIATGTVLLAGLGTLLGTGVVGGDGIAFEYDFKKLRPENVSHGISWSGTLHGTSRRSVYLLADDPQALSEASDELRKHRPLNIAPGDAPFLLVPGSFIPPEQQQRLEAIALLRATLEAAKRDAKPELRQRIEDFEPLTEVTQPITLEQMPRWVLDWLVEKDGRFGTLAILYTSLSGADARAMEVLADQMQAWRERFKHVRFASPESLVGEVTPTLRKEAPVIIGLALLGVLIGTLVVGRSLKRTLLVLLPLMVMIGLSIGVMALCGIRVNLYNMLVFPLAFGIGVDGAVYVSWALRGREALGEQRLPAASRAVLGSTLTSMAGFGALMSSSNPGLFSIGLLALVMLGISLIANLLWLPALVWLNKS